MDVFEKIYNFETQYFEIPSRNAQVQVQRLLANTIAELSETEEKVLLLIFYDGHGAVKDGKLIAIAKEMECVAQNLNGMPKRARRRYPLVYPEVIWSA
jgi:hypothetical protein